MKPLCHTDSDRDSCADHKLVLDFYMKSKSGFLLRAVGDNEKLVTSLAKHQGNVKILGLAIANGLIALAGCIFCQEERVFEIL